MIPQIVMEGDSPRARRSDPIESHMAADATARQVWRSQRIVEDVLLCSPVPLDDLAILPLAVAVEGLSAARFRSARAELKKAGYVESAGRHKAPNEDGKITARGLWRHAKFNDEYHYCDACEVEHWWRLEAGTKWVSEFRGPCGSPLEIIFDGQPGDV